VERLQTGPGLIDRSYGYGFTGNITSITANAADSLPEPQITAGVEQYGYEVGTNKLSDIDLVSGVGISRSYTYDNNGNTLSDGTRTFTWNQDNRLTSVASAGGVAQYAYNGKGQRVKKIAGLSTTIYHYDLQGNQIETTRQDGSLIADFVYAGSNRIARVKPDNTVYYYHNDHLGTPLAMTNQAGQVVWSAYYLPLGEAVVTTETIKNNFRFPGQYYDAETGLHYNYHRYYDPATGRYVSADPIGLWGGINLYRYVSNNPVMRVDPLGLYWFRQSWQTPEVVGRRDTPIEPGGLISEFIEQYVPAGYTFGEIHDNFVDAATRAGIPDGLANIPSMIPMYTIALDIEVLRTLGILSQPKPQEKPTPCK
jgi:RHS repeat-associated protein